MNKDLITVKISEDLVVEVTPHVEHEWLLSSKDVAEGYGLSESSLRSTKSRHSDELEEGKHWVVADCNTLGGTQQTIYWTKKGVIRLGFLIKTPLAKQFRDWAEDFIINKSAEVKPIAVPKTFSEALKLAYEQSLQIEMMKPKVELYDNLTHQDEDTINTMTLSEVGKALGYKPKKEFFPMLRESDILFKNSNEPTSLYVQKGWFKATPYNNGAYAGMSWKVTTLGMAEILKKFGRRDNSKD